jgi:hypothetical protein
MSNTSEKNLPQNGVGYYNKGEYKDNKEEYIPNGTSSVLLGRASPLASPHAIREVESLDSKPRGKEELLDSGAAAEDLAPLGPHNIKRAMIQFFNNPDGRKFKVRVNLADGTNAEFIAPLQPISNLTNFLKHTGDHKEDAREWFTEIRAYCKKQYETKPQQGKFHENTGKRGQRMKTIAVEPSCYGSVCYNPEDRSYIGFVKIYDLILSDIGLEEGYLTELQKKNNVRGQYLWINPRFDTRERPLTWAEKRKRGLA